MAAEGQNHSETNTKVSELKMVPTEFLHKAQKRMKGKVTRTPLIRLNAGDSDTKIFLKLENLQATGSFKQRGAFNALHLLPPDKLKDGVYTASAGNFAQGLAYHASLMGIPCHVVVPENAPKTKLKAIEKYGGKLIKVPYDRWWQTMMEHTYPGLSGSFIHPVVNTGLIAGQGTVGLEILEDLPEVDAVVAPYGGGGLCTGVASALKALKPQARMYACEVDTAAPLSISLAAGKPCVVQNHKTSFVDGMGGKGLLPDMWNLASNLIPCSIVVTLQEISDAVRLLVESNHVVAEGAGAAPVAAALSGKAGTGNIVCVVSGGNIDSSTLVTILQGKIPQ